MALLHPTTRYAVTVLLAACLSACGGDDSPPSDTPPPTGSDPGSGDGPGTPAPSMRCAP
ncbi:hypothetical protein GCM10023144_01890 [Pigmentiphaga soli]|uniref:Lipoprotein n=1 Tax=Pigmentiphaga soli TaxID=1007095 RepID=A0ABP8GD85_9BURK